MTGPSPAGLNGRTDFRRVLGTAGGVLLGAVFLLAAVSKAPDPPAFAEQVRLEGLDFLFPAYTVALLALALEAGLGTLLISGVRRLWVLVPTGLLVAFFLFLTGRNYWYVSQGLRDPDSSCGCFGNLIQRTPAEAFWQDLFLMVPALLLAFMARPASTPRLPRFRLAGAFLAAAGIVVFAVGYGAPSLDAYRIEARSDLENHRYSPVDIYRIVIDGVPDEDGGVYFSDDTAALLVLTAQLPDPVLLSPRSFEVAVLERAELVPHEDGSIDLPVGLKISPKGDFKMEASHVHFSLNGRQVRLELRAGG